MQSKSLDQRPSVRSPEPVQDTQDNREPEHNPGPARIQDPIAAAAARGQYGGPPASYGLSQVDLNSVVPLRRAAEISSLSEDTWRRRFPHLIIKLSERRSGVRLKHALFVDTS
jgi:hypothetical protein